MFNFTCKYLIFVSIIICYEIVHANIVSKLFYAIINKVNIHKLFIIYNVNKFEY
jgi:hypothetical protein